MCGVAPKSLLIYFFTEEQATFLKGRSGCYKRCKGNPIIYFIEAIGLGLVKIGKTTDLQRRFRGISSNCPVPIQVLKWVPGYSDEEKTLHKRFKEYRRHGEWFELEPIRRAIRGF